MAGSSNKTPEFFTVFLPEFCFHQLKMTPSFKVHLEKEGSGEVIIERSATANSSREVWKVGLVKEGEDFIFKKGWKEFVSENGVTIGEFMVFQYHGNSRFTVDIYGTDGLQKLAPGKQTAILLDKDGKGDTDDKDCDNLGGTAKAVGRMSLKGNKTAKKIRKKVSTNPSSFRVCMTKSYIANCSMHLPNEFSNRYISGKDVQRIELKTAEKTWSVGVLAYQKSSSNVYYMFRGEGFGDFLRHNRVGAGNICVFEALDLPCTTLSASVLRTTGHYD